MTRRVQGAGGPIMVSAPAALLLLALSAGAPHPPTGPRHLHLLSQQGKCVAWLPWPRPARRGGCGSRVSQPPKPARAIPTALRRWFVAFVYALSSRYSSRRRSLPHPAPEPAASLVVLQNLEYANQPLDSFSV